MARFLMAPYAPTTGLAHVGTCIVVGSELRARGHEVAFAYGGALPDTIEREGFPVHAVAEVDPAREWGGDGYFADADDCGRLVTSHRRLLSQLRPDAVVTSSGVASRIAAEAEAVPELILMHYLGATRFARATSAGIWGRRLRDGRRPRRVARIVRDRVTRRHRRLRIASIMAETRSRLGLEPVEADLRAAAAVACTTTPFLDPTRGLPPRWRYVGPILWSVPTRPGAGVDRPGDGRPVVYVTQGTTGSPELLRRAVADLAGEPVEVIAAAATHCDPGELAALGPNVRAERYLPHDACLAACDVAVVHGGHLSTVAALAAGKPAVVMPTYPDQIAWLGRVERLGTGIGLWPEPRRGAIRRAVNRILSRPVYAERSAAIAARLREWDGARGAAELAEAIASTSSTDASGARARSSGSAQR